MAQTVKLTLERRLDLSAASGLAKIGETYFVVADDQLHLAALSPKKGAPSRRIRLFPGRLPTDVQKRKQRKPDLEALVAIPAVKTLLLAIPSGSKDNRIRGAAVEVSAHGAGKPRIIDFSPLYEYLGEELPGRLNIEGACVRKNELILAQRGNSKKAENALITLSLPKVLARLKEKSQIDAKALKRVKVYQLGKLDDVKLSFTDLSALSDGTLVYSAAAEATDDAYEDAPFTGSVLGRVSVEGRLLPAKRVLPRLKVEGLWTEAKAGKITVRIVTDADDPGVMAGFYRGTF